MAESQTLCVPLAPLSFYAMTGTPCCDPTLMLTLTLTLSLSLSLSLTLQPQPHS